MNGNGSTLQLAYFFSPDVMGQSVAGQNSATLDLVVMISNPTDAPVEVTHITIEIPSGQDISGDISAATTLPSPVYDTTIPWSITMSADTVTVRPTRGNTAFVTGPILFTIPTIAINETPGTVQLIITEYYPPPTPKAEDNTTYTLVKQPTTVPVSQFLVTPAVVTNLDAQVTLSWTCTSQGVNDSFGLRAQSTGQPHARAAGARPDSSSAPTPAAPGQLRPCGQSGQCYTAKEGAAGIPFGPVNQTTTFALDVYEPIGRGDLQLVTTLFATVQVVVPSISQESSVVPSQTGQLVRVHWSTLNATSCSLKVDGVTVLSGLPTDTYLSGYPVLVGPTPSPHQFELVAHGVNSAANASYPLGDVPVTPIAPIPTGAGPGDVVITQDGSFAFVMNGSDNSLTPINLQTTPPTATSAIQLADTVSHMALTPDGESLLLALVEQSQVVKVDVLQRQIADTIGNVAGAYSIGITPDSFKALVAGVTGDVAALIDIDDNQVLANIAVDRSPMNVAVTPDGLLGLVLCGATNAIRVVDILARSAEPQAIQVGINWGTTSITPDGQTAVVVPNSGQNAVLIDIPSRSVVGTIPIGQDGGTAVFSPDGTLAFIVSQGGQVVTVLDIGSRSVVATIPVSGYPTDIAVTPDGLLALVVSQNKVVAIDVPSLTLTPLSVPVGGSPLAIAVTPDGSTVLVTNSGGNTVTVI